MMTGKAGVAGRRAMVAAAIAVGGTIAGVAPAAKQAPATPELFQKLVDCKAIAAPDQRLACYDTQVAALDAARKTKDIVVVSKAEVKEARRSLFGFQLPNFNIFGGGEKVDKADDISKLDTTVVRAAPLYRSNWALTLAEGGTWETTTELAVEPRAGDKVTITKAALGSFIGRVGENHGVRMRRVQ